MNTSVDDYEIIILDNNSECDYSESIVSQSSKIRYLRLEDNIGFPTANNIGIKMSNGKYVLLLNPDTIIYPNTIESSLLKIESDKKIGCLGVKTLLENGKVFDCCARKFPSMRNMFFNRLYFNRLFKSFQFFTSVNLDYWDHNDSREVDMIHGGFMLIPRIVIDKIGLLDTKLALFYEDNEYCCRVKKNGYLVYYLSDVYITHFSGISTKKANPRWINEMRHEAWYLLFNEYGKYYQKYLFWIIVMFVSPLTIIGLTCLYPFFKKQKNKIVYELCFTYHGIFWAVKKIVKKFYE